jgi:phage regulator Rha-like protein
MTSTAIPLDAIATTHPSAAPPTAKRLNEQVKRNIARYPCDFMFQLTDQELASLRSQFATLKTGRGQHRKYLPYAFTEHGAIMAAMILNSARATEVSVHVVRAFIRLRHLAASNKALALRLDELEGRTELLSLKQDTFEQDSRIQLKHVFDALRELIAQPAPPRKRPIGFVTPDE